MDITAMIGAPPVLLSSAGLILCATPKGTGQISSRMCFCYTAKNYIMPGTGIQHFYQKSYRWPKRSGNKYKN
jgi:hypothetical protein